MKRCIFIFIAALLPALNSYTQYSREDLIRTAIEATISADIYSLGGWSSLSELPAPQVFFFDDVFQFDGEYGSINQVVHSTGLMHQQLTRCASLQTAGYVAFMASANSAVVRVDVFYNRPAYLNAPNTNSYLFWSKMNGGMSYQIHFAENGCIREIERRSAGSD